MNIEELQWARLERALYQVLFQGALDADWKEGEHPRRPNGEFGEGGGASKTDASGKMTGNSKVRKSVNPNDLVFREEDQNRTSEILDRLGDNPEEWNPIVLIGGEDGQETILDGHNRASVAQEIGATEIPAVSISEAEYKFLQDRGYDDAEISYAALSRAEEYEAASAINQQFPGSGVGRRGREAENDLSDRG